MTKQFAMKYLKEVKGGFKYRRRVPTELKQALGKVEIVKSLGKSQMEALKAYPAVHQSVERRLRSARSFATSGSSISMNRDEITSAVADYLEHRGFDPNAPIATEREVRGISADLILSNYPVDEETGQPRSVDVSPLDHAIVSALYGGMSSVELPYTTEDAFRFYAQERGKTDPVEERSLQQRLARAKTDLHGVTGGAIELADLTRDHARAYRDRLSKRMKPSSVKRNINTVKAVINLSVRERDLNLNNPFNRLELKASDEAAIDTRDPLPGAVIRKMYDELASSSDLLDMWAIVHGTGCRSAEVLGALSDDVVLDSDYPHLVVRPHPHRRLKTGSRERRVPLVGRTLEVLKRRRASADRDGLMFPKYAKGRNRDNFSAAIMKRLRKYTSDPKHEFYSLRHNMKDTLIEVGATLREQNAILGHTDGSSAEAGYGRRRNLSELTEVMEKAEKLLIVCAPERMLQG
eukprot:TRINITY_DN14536_c0_g1_i1.p1 TRINITY_DN14536_c0_g1~~TRINITY_DN14536_c0_g1_i1.p1  ORF type:complete len:464 (-),score=-3.66 TRINITY_DN14536_c0_g1_i1:198-1589(-)